MTREIEELSIDGVRVDVTKCRVAGTFDVSPDDENLLVFDEEVVFVGVARVAAPAFRSAKGEVTRTNALKVSEVRFVWNEDERDDILDLLNFEVRPGPSVFGTGSTDGDASGTITRGDEPSEDFEEGGRVQGGLPPSVPSVENLEEWRSKVAEVEEEFNDEPVPTVPMTDGRVSTISPAVESDRMLRRFLEEV